MDTRPGVWIVLLLLFAPEAAGRPAPQDEPLAPKAPLQRLESIAKDAAARGRDAEMVELLDVLRRLGEEPAQLAKVRGECLKSLAAASAAAPATAPALTRIARDLHLLAGELTRLLSAPRDARSDALAVQILRLDDEQPLAHQLLGHAFENGQWTSDEWRRQVARRSEIEAALAESKRLAIPLECVPCEFEPLAAFDPRPATAIRYGRVEVIATIEPKRLERIVRNVLRAAALSNFLRCGEVAVPGPLMDFRETIVLIAEREKYLRSIERALAAKALKPEEEGRARALDGYVDGRGFYVAAHAGEVASCADLLFELDHGWLDPNLQVCLVCGHVNWLCLTCFGATMPRVVPDPGDGERGGGRSFERPRDTPEERRAVALASAGISGARRFMTFKALHGEDPAWSRSFVDDVWKLVDLDLLKSTFVVEFLQESGRFETLLRRTAMKEQEKRSIAEVIEAEIPEGLPAFEERFDAWLLPHGAAIVQRLEAAAQSERPSREEAAALAELESIRRAAWDEKRFGPFRPIDCDRELSAACVRHAAYLKLHPEQLGRWPDIHEEYPDRAGFSAEGCWAGTHSVIQPDAASPEAAIRAFMASFYHRLPLLDPGLKRIGFSLSDQIALLDAGSLVEADSSARLVSWPPRDMKGVPVAFQPELPSPVPGQDQKQWGYPVTLQVFGLETTYAMRLVRGGRPDGPEIPCHFSSPGAPLNPELHPPGAYCLIPKSPLERRAKYTVVADASDGSSLVWSFTTEE